MEDLALGSYEAACVLGVHWTQPATMARRGRLLARIVAAGTNSFAVYSLRDCERDYQEYLEMQAQPGRPRPRAHLANRPAQLRRNAKIKHRIPFVDAISAYEAAEIMGCHWTWPPRMAREGAIIGRIVHNGRPSASDRLWIFSRASCEANAAIAKKQAASGRKIGRPRRSLAR